MTRLLSNKQAAMAFGGYDFRTDDMRTVCKAQDRKTLKAVGEWLDRYTGKHIPNWHKMIESLKKGEMPE